VPALGPAPFGTPGAGIVAVPATGSNVALFNQGGFGGNNGNDWFATARVRVGYGFDRVLVYATGGLAFTDSGNKNNGFFGVTNGSQLPAAFYVSGPAAAFGPTVGTGGFFGKNSNNDVGWVIGAGVEYAFTNNLTVSSKACGSAWTTRTTTTSASATASSACQTPVLRSAARPSSAATTTTTTSSSLPALA
jgi:opacity protein-like surface antigen